MKYAFIFGSNVFIVPSNTISYIDNDQTTEFLRIKSLYGGKTGNDKEFVLTIDANVKDIEGRNLILADNIAQNAFGFTVTAEPDRILVVGADNKTVLDVHQLANDVAMDLEHNIVAELEAHFPVVAIRVRGDFMLGRLHTEADNEKLFIIGNSYANATLTGNNGLAFTASGIEV